MNRLLPLSLAAIAAGCMGPSGPPAPLSAERQSELARELRGRVAGAPLSCVQQRDIRSNRAFGDQLILFQGRNNTEVYINTPRARCPGLLHGRTLITRTFSTRLCAGDIAEIVEPVSGTFVGSCPLGDFTPYRR